MREATSEAGQGVSEHGLVTESRCVPISQWTRSLSEHGLGNPNPEELALSAGDPAEQHKWRRGDQEGRGVLVQAGPREASLPRLKPSRPLNQDLERKKPSPQQGVKGPTEI